MLLLAVASLLVTFCAYVKDNQPTAASTSQFIASADLNRRLGECLVVEATPLLPHQAAKVLPNFYD